MRNRSKCCKAGCEDCPWNYNKSWESKFEWFWLIALLAVWFIVVIVFYIVCSPFLYVYYFFVREKYPNSVSKEGFPVATEKSDQYEELNLNLRGEIIED